MPRSLTLLHLSDLQFGPLHRFESAPHASLLERLTDDLARMSRDVGLAPDLVLLTGDLVEHGMRDQFAEARRFCVGLAAALGLPRRRVVVIPGNHDINRKKAEAYFRNCEGDGDTPAEPYWPKLSHYADFFRALYEGEPDLAFTEAAPYTLFAYPELSVVVAGLDSSLKDSHRAEDHYGFVGEPQLRAFASRLRPYRERGFLRIGCVHHDPLVSDCPKATLQDRRDFERILAPELNLLLHGHIHEDQLQWMKAGARPPVPVMAIGSGGVVTRARPDEVRNQYQLIRVEESQIAYATRAWEATQKRWVTETRADPEHGARELVPIPVRLADCAAAFAGEGEPDEAVKTKGARDAHATRDATDRAARLEAARRRMVALHKRQTFDQLAGRAEDWDIAGGLDLLSVFVPQKARPTPLDARARPPRAEPGARTEPAARSILQLLEAGDPPWRLILGAPGAGKSTLLHYVALTLLRPADPVEPATPRADVPVPLPVYVALRKFDERSRVVKQAGRDYDLFRYVDEVHGERSIPLAGDLLRDLAAAGRIYWLFDGLDEIPDVEARRDVAQMVVGLKGAHGGRGLVTSRVVGAHPVQPALEDGGLATFTLEEFDRPRVDEFLDRWHEAAFANAPDVGRSRLARLRAARDGSPALETLCRNPLLLTLIALLNRGGELPRRRHRIYARAVELMASQWDANKGLGATAPLDSVEKHRFLRELAFRMMTELPGGPGNRITEDDLARFATAWFRKERGQDVARAERSARTLLAGMRERDYVLAWLGESLWGFVHKSFLEYLAADAMRARFQDRTWAWADLVARFVSRSHDDDLREPLLLVCGMLGEERAELVPRLLQAMLAASPPARDAEREHGAGDEDDRGDRAFLAFAGFAFAALAELKTLEVAPMRDFALALGELLRARVPATRPETLRARHAPVLAALRLLGPAWPERERFVEWVRTGPPAGAWREIAGPWCLALSDATHRLADLTALLAGERDAWVVRAALAEAARHGEWGGDERAVLLDRSRYATDAPFAAACDALSDADADVGPAIEPLTALLESPDASPEAAFHAALTLDREGAVPEELEDRVNELYEFDFTERRIVEAATSPSSSEATARPSALARARDLRARLLAIDTTRANE